MSFLTGKHTMENTSTVPAGISKEAVVAVLHDHAFLIGCGPHYTSHKSLPPSTTITTASDATKSFKLISKALQAAGEDGTPTGSPVVSPYEVTDNLPNPVFSSTVVQTVEYVNLKGGLAVKSQTPMGVGSETLWLVKEEGGEVKIVQEAVFQANKLVMGFVKTQIEANRGKLHTKIIDKLTGKSSETAGAEGEGEAALAAA